MENMFRLNVELNLSAQKIMQQVYLNNKTIETSIEDAMEQAFKELADEKSFVKDIKESVKEQIKSFVRQNAFSYDMQKSLRTAIDEKVTKKISDYAEQIATQ